MIRKPSEANTVTEPHCLYECVSEDIFTITVVVLADLPVMST